MLPRFTKIVTRLVASLVALATCCIAGAERAILVGINRYANLGEENQLKGCINDVLIMERTLWTFGFRENVRKLTDSGATKAKILKAFSEVPKAKDNGEPLVIYFACHGRQYPTHGLLTHESTLEPSAEDFQKDEVTNELTKFSKLGYAVTLILDSCYSGLIVKASSRGQSRTVLMGGRKDGLAFGEEHVSLVDKLNAMPSTVGSPCYVAATENGQTAKEFPVKVAELEALAGSRSLGDLESNDSSAEAVVGLFTRSLFEESTKLGAVKLAWSSFLQRVNLCMAEKAGGEVQSSQVSPAYRSVQVLRGAGAKGVIEPDKRITSLFKTVEANFSEDLSLYVVNSLTQEQRLEVCIGEPVLIVAEGKFVNRYPMLIELTGGEYKRMNPKGLPVLEVGNDSTPTKLKFEAKERTPWSFCNVMDEELTLILFSSQELANEVARIIPSGEGGVSVTLKDSRTSQLDSAMITKRVSLRVVLELYGGGLVTDVRKCAQRLLNGGTPILDKLKGRITEQTKYLAKLTENSATWAEETYYALNQSMFRVTPDGKNIEIILSEDCLRGVTLRPITQTAIKAFPKLPAKLKPLVNRLILEDVLGPDVLNFGPEPKFDGAGL